MVRRGLLILGLGMLIAMLIGWGKILWRDVHLTECVVKDVKVEYHEIGGMSALRQVGDDRWNLYAKNVERRLPDDVLQGISSDITGPSGLRTIIAQSGVYNAEAEYLTLQTAHGEWQRLEHPFSWKTPEAQWRQKKGLWIFPRGLEISGDVYTLEGEYAEMRGSEGKEEYRIEKGCLRWWSE